MPLSWQGRREFPQIPPKCPLWGEDELIRFWWLTVTVLWFVDFLFYFVVISSRVLLLQSTSFPPVLLCSSPASLFPPHLSHISLVSTFLFPVSLHLHPLLSLDCIQACVVPSLFVRSSVVVITSVLLSSSFLPPGKKKNRKKIETDKQVHEVWCLPLGWATNNIVS